MIRTSGLTKRYGPVLAVDRIDLDVREGDVYGFLGANGSGKTTTVRMLLGLVLATSGRGRGAGSPDAPVLGDRAAPTSARSSRGRRRTSTSAGGPTSPLFDAMGGASRRRPAAAASRRPSSRSACRAAADRRVRGYSLGMRQRLGLAAALLRAPRLLVLDEPTNGLDPQGIREVRDLLLRLNAAGTTIFLSSHLLAEVEQLCTRVGVLDRGRLVVQDDLAELQGPTGRTVVRTPTPRPRTPCSTGASSTATATGSWSASRTRPRSTRSSSVPACASPSCTPSGAASSRSSSTRPQGSGDVR